MKNRERLDCWIQYCCPTYSAALLDKQRKYHQSKELYLERQRNTNKALNEQVSTLREKIKTTVDSTKVKLFRYNV